MANYLYKISNDTGRKSFIYITPKLDLGSSGIDKKISSIKFFLNENVSGNFSFYYRINEISDWTTLSNPTSSVSGEYYKYKIGTKVRTIQLMIVGLAAESGQNSQLNGISIIYRKFTGR